MFGTTRYKQFDSLAFHERIGGRLRDIKAAFTKERKAVTRKAKSIMASPHSRRHQSTPIQDFPTNAIGGKQQISGFTPAKTPLLEQQLRIDISDSVTHNDASAGNGQDATGVVSDEVIICHNPFDTPGDNRHGAQDSAFSSATARRAMASFLPAPVVPETLWQRRTTAGIGHAPSKGRNKQAYGLGPRVNGHVAQHHETGPPTKPYSQLASIGEMRDDARQAYCIDRLARLSLHQRLLSAIGTYHQLIASAGRAELQVHELHQMLLDFNYTKYQHGE